MKAKPTFEHETCSRCCGTGNYSYSSMYGKRCFGCHGIGYKLTKRGQAAQNLLNKMRLIPLENFEIGDSIRIDGFNAGSYVEPTVWAKVTGKKFLNGVEAGYVDYPERQFVEIETSHGNLLSMIGGDAIYRKGFSVEKKQEQVTEALAYQATLTKTGKPRKQKLAA